MAASAAPAVVLPSWLPASMTRSLIRGAGLVKLLLLRVGDIAGELAQIAPALFLRANRLSSSSWLGELRAQIREHLPH